MFPSPSVANTRACPNLIHLSFISLHLHSRIHYQNIPRLHTATCQAMEVVESVLPYICIGDLCTGIWFGIIASLALNVLLGPTNIYKFIKGIFPIQRRVLPIHLRGRGNTCLQPISSACCNLSQQRRELRPSRRFQGAAESKKGRARRLYRPCC